MIRHDNDKEFGSDTIAGKFKELKEASLLVTRSIGKEIIEHPLRFIFVVASVILIVYMARALLE